MDENYESANTKAQLVEQTLINLGFRAKVEDLNAVDAWAGSLPGNVGRFIRRPMVSCANLIHMMPISDIWAGEPRNKHFQAPPLIYTQTVGIGGRFFDLGNETQRLSFQPLAQIDNDKERQWILGATCSMLKRHCA